MRSLPEDFLCVVRSRSFFSERSVLGELLSFLREVRRLSGLESLILKGMTGCLHVESCKAGVSA